MEENTVFAKLLAARVLKMLGMPQGESIDNELNVDLDIEDLRFDCMSGSLLEDLQELHGQILIHKIAIKDLQHAAKERIEAAFFDTDSDYMDEFLIKCFRHDLSSSELALLTHLNLQSYRF